MKKNNDELIKKVAIYGSWLMAVVFPVAILIWAYTNGKINQPDQLFNWLVIIGIIAGGNIAQWFLNKKQEEFNEKNKDVLNLKEAKHARLKWRLVAAPVVAFGIILAITQSPYEDALDQTENRILLYTYGIVITYLIFKATHSHIPKNKGFISPVTYYSVYFLGSIFYILAIPMTLARINLSANDENIEIRKTVLFKGNWIGMYKHRRYCYRLRHWENEEQFTSASFCNNKYPRLKEGEEVEIVIKTGNLGFKYVEEVIIPRLVSFDAYISFVAGAKNLRYFDIVYLDNLKGRDFHHNQSKNWEKSCNKNKPYKCRLSSYLYSRANQQEKAKALLEIGCQYDDFFSCSGLYLLEKEGSEAQEDLLKKITYLCKDLSELPEDGKEPCEWYENERKRVLPKT